MGQPALPPAPGNPPSPQGYGFDRNATPAPLGPIGEGLQTKPVTVASTNTPETGTIAGKTSAAPSATTTSAGGAYNTAPVVTTTVAGYNTAPTKAASAAASAATTKASAVTESAVTGSATTVKPATTPSEGEIVSFPAKVTPGNPGTTAAGTEATKVTAIPETTSNHPNETTVDVPSPFSTVFPSVSTRELILIPNFSHRSQDLSFLSSLYDLIELRSNQSELVISLCSSSLKLVVIV